ncbi:MAG: hypothetical protein ACM30H_00395 [Clostridia bacterium]
MPLWRWLVIGFLFAGAALYFLFTGEIAVNKARTVFLSRGTDPLAYWSIVLVLGALGALSLRQAWRQLTGRD